MAQSSAGSCFVGWFVARRIEWQVLESILTLLIVVRTIQDDTAVFCAQSFTKSENVVTVGVNRIGFYMPVTMMDFVTMSARVTRVSRSRMEIAVEVSLKGVRSTDVKKCVSGYGLSPLPLAMATPLRSNLVSSILAISRSHC
jgi:hypothetical protein